MFFDLLVFFLIFLSGRDRKGLNEREMHRKRLARLEREQRQLERERLARYEQAVRKAAAGDLDSRQHTDSNGPSKTQLKKAEQRAKLEEKRLKQIERKRRQEERRRTESAREAALQRERAADLKVLFFWKKNSRCKLYCSN